MVLLLAGFATKVAKLCALGGAAPLTGAGAIWHRRRITWGAFGGVHRRGGYFCSALRAILPSMECGFHVVAQLAINGLISGYCASARPLSVNMVIAGAMSRKVPRRKQVMPKYIIEREIPGAGKLSPQELQGIAQTSCGVLNKMGPQIQWVQSYVVDEKIYCVYIAPNEEMVREHARQGGFPANRVSEVKVVIDPTTAEA